MFSHIHHFAQPGQRPVDNPHFRQPNQWHADIPHFPQPWQRPTTMPLNHPHPAAQPAAAASAGAQSLAEKTGFNSLPVELKRAVLGHVEDLFPCLLVYKELTYLAGPILYSRLASSTSTTVNSSLPLVSWVGRRSARMHKVFSGLDCLVPTDDAPFGSALKAGFLKGIENLRVVVIQESERRVGLGRMSGEEGMGGVWICAKAWELSAMSDILSWHQQDSAPSPLRNLRSLRIHLQPQGHYYPASQFNYSSWISASGFPVWVHPATYGPGNSYPSSVYPPVPAYPHHYPYASTERFPLVPTRLSLLDHEAIYAFASACSPSHLLEWPLMLPRDGPWCSWHPMRGAPPREVVHNIHGMPEEVGHPVTVCGSRNVVRLNPVEEPVYAAPPAVAVPYAHGPDGWTHSYTVGELAQATIIPMYAFNPQDPASFHMVAVPVSLPAAHPGSVHFAPVALDAELPWWGVGELAEWVVKIVGHAHATPETALSQGLVRVGEEDTTWEFHTERMASNGYLIGCWEEEEVEFVREMVGAGLGQLSGKVTVMLPVMPEPDVRAETETVATDGGSIYGELDEVEAEVAELDAELEADLEAMFGQLLGGWVPPTEEGEGDSDFVAGLDWWRS
ncbi:hypothetical protein IAT38_006559 [Cryptococcus sp. DSM 104549]